MGTNYDLHRVEPDGFCSVLHIGKASAGWMFLFRFHEGTAENVEDWRRLTKEGAIFDEYRHKVLYEYFWEMVKTKQPDRFEIDDHTFLIGGYNFCNREFS